MRENLLCEELYYESLSSLKPGRLMSGILHVDRSRAAPLLHVKGRN
jgi:hypothetical protein